MRGDLVTSAVALPAFLSQPCADCGCRTWPSKLHVTAAQRVELRARGMRRVIARGLCTTCHQRHRRAGTLARFTVADANPITWHVQPACTRCGVRRELEPSNLCGDCLLVVGDLGEAERWAS